MDLMIDLECLGEVPDGIILTIAAQTFDPFGKGYRDDFYYARIEIESQPERTVHDNVVNWWATQGPEAQEEAFGPDNRVTLAQALDELTKIAWKCENIWANSPTYDLAMLENAYKYNKKNIPWQFWQARDTRTVYSLVPNLEKPPTPHHALEDARRQIIMLQDALRQLNVKEIK